MVSKIAAKCVRYIKLGEGSMWARECLQDDTARVGYWSNEPLIFDLCVNRRWDELQGIFASRQSDSRTVTRFIGEVRAFFEDKGETLWITFENQHMYWTFLDPDPPWTAKDGEGSYRKVVGWKCVDNKGEPLRMAGLSGNLTKTAGYRGTICSVTGAAEYALSRINGEQRAEVVDAVRLAADLERTIARMLQLLTWKDFELLVDLVFAHSGWRRISLAGKTQKTIDMEVLLPSTGERAFIQVKSATSQRQFDEYRASFDELDYDKMFYVFHTGTAQCHDKRIVLIDGTKLARMVLNAGLLYWLTEKAA